MGGHPVELHHHHPDDVGALGDLVLDAEQPLDAGAVDVFVEQRREVVHPRHEGDALGPVAVLAVLLDAGVQVADAEPAVGDRLTLELEDQPEHAVGRWVLRPHVDDDPLLARLTEPGRELVPVLAGDGVDGALRRLLRGRVGVGVLLLRHQL